MNDEWIASPPSAWPELERDFHLAYRQDRSAFPRQPVTVRWEGVAIDDNRPELHPIGLVVWAIVAAYRAWGEHRTRATRTTKEFEVLAVEVERAEGGRRMHMSVSSETAPLERTGVVPAVLVGGFGSNAVTCVEVGGLVLWPTGPPVERTD